MKVIKIRTKQLFMGFLVISMILLNSSLSAISAAAIPDNYVLDIIVGDTFPAGIDINASNIDGEVTSYSENYTIRFEGVEENGNCYEQMSGMTILPRKGYLKRGDDIRKAVYSCNTAKGLVYEKISEKNGFEEYHLFDAYDIYKGLGHYIYMDSDLRDYVYNASESFVLDEFLTDNPDVPEFEIALARTDMYDYTWIVFSTPDEAMNESGERRKVVEWKVESIIWNVGAGTTVTLSPMFALQPDIPAGENTEDPSGGVNTPSGDGGASESLPNPTPEPVPEPELEPDIILPAEEIPVNPEEPPAEEESGNGNPVVKEEKKEPEKLQKGDVVQTGDAMNKMLWIILFLLSIFLLTYCAYNISKIQTENARGESFYFYARKSIKIKKESNTMESMNIEKADSCSGDDEENAVCIDVDWQGFSDNVIGWIFIDDNVINYPVIQSTDNVYYTNHLYNGTYNENGSIFVDYRNKNLIDLHTIIYGHNMKNGSMFHNIVKYQDQKYADKHPYIYIVERNGNTRIYQVFSCFITDAYGDKEYSAYTINQSSEEWIQWMHTTKDRSIINTTIPLFDNQNIITLSTCTSRGKKSERCVVHAIEIMEKDIPDESVVK